MTFLGFVKPATMILVALVAIVFTAQIAHAKTFSAALLKSGLPDEDSSLNADLKRQLEAAGYSVTEIGCSILGDSSKLTTKEFSLLVLPDSSSLPIQASTSIEAYAKSGGKIIALKTPLWQRSLIEIDGKWVAQEEYTKQRSAVPPEKILLDFSTEDLSKWARGSNNPEDKVQHEVSSESPLRGQKSLHVVISNLTGHETFARSGLQNSFPEGHTLTVFTAKGGPRTNQMAVEWAEADGSRWIAVVPLTTEWRQYVLQPKDFHRWLDNAPDHKEKILTPSRVGSMAVGLAFTHTTALESGHQEYWVTGFGTAKVNAEYEALMTNGNPAVLDTLSPRYKFYECADVGAMKIRSDQAVFSVEDLPVPKKVFSSYPRPRGVGFDRGRDWRWIPLIEASSSNGDSRGFPATMLIHSDGPFKGGMWASFSVVDSDWYHSPKVLEVIGQIARKMQQPVYMLDGGSQFFTYFDKQEMILGLQACNFAQDLQIDLTARFLVTANGKKIFETNTPMRVNGGEVERATASFTPKRWPKDGCEVKAEILQNGKVIDQVSHQAFLWQPKAKKEYVTIENGQFMLNGERWRPHGVNYMPSSGLGTEEGQYFEMYLHKGPYDPEVYVRDLDHVKDLGFNAISIFIYGDMYRGVANKDQNLLDILRLAEERNLKVNLSLRPGDPVNTPTREAREMIREFIEYYRLKDNDTVFAYDLAWEPSFGDQRDRAKFDQEWEAWVIERYGSIENAEKDWNYPIPRDAKGQITNPNAEQIDRQGEWRTMSVAYRRFLDFLLYKRYKVADLWIHQFDPKHYISFRMSEAANPNYRWEGRITYDFPYMAAALGLLEPEAYGRIGTWERAKPGWFVREWARWAAPTKPMIWAEAGVNIWDQSRLTQSPKRTEYGVDSYKEFYRLLISSCADGVFYWWYPGGYRYGENSDYGVINPDGTDREVSRVIRDTAKPFTDGPSLKPVDHWIEIDRDAEPAGVAGVYDKVEAEFWKSIEDGKTPGLRTSGTGKNSATCPLLAVGNSLCNGTNPPKYLDASFDRIEVLDASGDWKEAQKGGSVEVTEGKPVYARILITNLGEASWLTEKAARSEGGLGAVQVVVDSDEMIRCAIPREIGHHDSFLLKKVCLAKSGITSERQVRISLTAKDRTPFGEKFTLKLTPAEKKARK